jgi:hypothetical protein
MQCDRTPLRMGFAKIKGRRKRDEAEKAIRDMAVEMGSISDCETIYLYTEYYEKKKADQGVWSTRWWDNSYAWWAISQQMLLWVRPCSLWARAIPAIWTTSFALKHS